MIFKIIFMILKIIFMILKIINMILKIIFMARLSAPTAARRRPRSAPDLGCAVSAASAADLRSEKRA